MTQVTALGSAMVAAQAKKAEQVMPRVGYSREGTLTVQLPSIYRDKFPDGVYAELREHPSRNGELVLILTKSKNVPGKKIRPGVDREMEGVPCFGLSFGPNSQQITISPGIKDFTVMSALNIAEMAPPGSVCLQIRIGADRKPALSKEFTKPGTERINVTYPVTNEEFAAAVKLINRFKDQMGDALALAVVDGKLKGSVTHDFE